MLLQIINENKKDLIFVREANKNMLKKTNGYADKNLGVSNSKLNIIDREQGQGFELVKFP